MSKTSGESFIESELKDKNEKDKNVMKYKNRSTKKIIFFPENIAKKSIGSNGRGANSQSVDDLSRGADAGMQR